MAKLGNVKLRTLRDVAYESIYEAIMKHELMPGETLTITNLAEKLDISPTPVREAVVRLSNEGILDYEANKRIKVSQIQRADVCEVYEARRLLELHIAQKLTGVVNKNRALRKTLETLRDETRDLVRDQRRAEEYTLIDLKLHELFLDMMDNGLLGELLYLVGNKSLRIRTFVEATNEDKEISSAFLQAGAQEHLDIIEALLRCDAEGAAAAVEAHLVNSEKRTLKSLDDYFNAL